MTGWNRSLDIVMEQKKGCLGGSFFCADPVSIRESTGTLCTFKAFFPGNDEAFL
ncbi:MAG: hypothetical protein METHP_00403 [Methanoregula sp. SKADARSKE-2]|nr:MAG: hypothetical protein METHP_00403 [Methanoregula sp. SKADARSKE-2]